jgi:hypothetical protein
MKIEGGKGREKCEIEMLRIEGLRFVSGWMSLK